MHSDNEVNIDPESVIVSVSLGEQRTINFSHKSKQQSLVLKDGSVYVMSRISQEVWKHGIDPVVDNTGSSSTDSTKGTGIRYSLTFRHITPFYKNSSVIIGE